MNKTMLIMSIALLSGVIHAEEVFDKEKVTADKVFKITYSFSVERDKECDAAVWTETVRSAAQAVEVAIAAEKGDASDDEMLRETLNAIEKTFACCGEKGIKGNLDISIGEPTKGCDGVCGGDPRDDK